MKLGNYTFVWEPDAYTIPSAKKFSAHVPTHSGVAYFSWGVSIVGKEIELEWDWMSAEQFLEIKSLYEEDLQKIWDIGSANRLWYSDPVNDPFVTGKTIISDGGATGDISAVNTIHNNLVLTDISGDFVEGESFQDNSIPAKTGSISALEIMPDYNVEILDFTGDYFKNMRTNFVWRQNVKLYLLIISEVS